MSYHIAHFVYYCLLNAIKILFYRKKIFVPCIRTQSIIFTVIVGDVLIESTVPIKKLMTDFKHNKFKVAIQGDEWCKRDSFCEGWNGGDGYGGWGRGK